MKSRVCYQKRVESSLETIKPLVEELLKAARENYRKEQSHKAASESWEETLFALEMCARELIVNAVKHGNSRSRFESVQSKACTVKVELAIAEEVLILSVEDSGCGFDWQKTLPLQVDEFSESGRGLAIVAALAEELEFNREGNRITVKLSCRG